MVPADSQQIPRARCYSGNPTTHTPPSSTTGLSPTPAGHSKPLHLTTMRTPSISSYQTSGPTTPHTQPLPGITCTRFSHIHVRSPLLAESLTYFLLLRVLRCFTSPRYPHNSYEFTERSPSITMARFPHSDILGSTLI